MLKARVITASVLLPMAVLLIVCCPTVVVSALVGVVVILAAWEWSDIVGLHSPLRKALNVAIIMLVAIFAKILQLPVLAVASVALGWWLLALLALMFYPKGANFWRTPLVGFVIGLLLFVPSWLALDWLHRAANFGPLWVLFLCCLVWASDVGAYCFGKLWGKKKLLPQVSSGKTWLGVLGAFVGGLLVLLVFAVILPAAVSLQVLLALTLIVVVASIEGDLVESLFKRIRGCKDSGNLLPGHGGVLDRIDGLLAAVPTFVVGLNFLQPK